MMNKTERDPDKELTTVGQVLLVIGALGMLIFLMFYTYNTPSLSGNRLGPWSYIVFWGRELLLVAFLVVGVIVGTVAWLCGLLRRLFSKLK